MIVGTEWLIDAAGCDGDLLRDVGLMRTLFSRILDELDLKAVGDIVWHRFPSPGGITGMALLTESHLACHTYPEFGIATFNLYCCRARPEWPWEERLGEMLGATSVIVRFVEREIGETHFDAPNQILTEMRGKQ